MEPAVFTGDSDVAWRDLGIEMRTPFDEKLTPRNVDCQDAVCTWIRSGEDVPSLLAGLLWGVWLNRILDDRNGRTWGEG